MERTQKTEDYHTTPRHVWSQAWFTINRGIIPSSPVFIKIQEFGLFSFFFFFWSCSVILSLIILSIWMNLFPIPIFLPSRKKTPQPHKPSSLHVDVSEDINGCKYSTSTNIVMHKIQSPPPSIQCWLHWIWLLFSLIATAL